MARPTAPKLLRATRRATALTARLRLPGTLLAALRHFSAPSPPATGSGVDGGGARKGIADAPRDPCATAPEGDGHPACHQSKTQPPPSPHPPARSSAVRRARTTPAAHRARPLHPRRGDPVTARRMKPTGSIAHVPKRRTERTEPATPVSAPVSGSGESDGGGGKTPTGTGDVPPLALRPPGLWSIARGQTVRFGRYIAGKPSFSPD